MKYTEFKKTYDLMHEEDKKRSIKELLEAKIIQCGRVHTFIGNDWSGNPVFAKAWGLHEWMLDSAYAYQDFLSTSGM